MMLRMTASDCGRGGAQPHASAETARQEAVTTRGNAAGREPAARKHGEARMQRNSIALGVATLVALGGSAASLKAADLPTIRVLATGGTIAGAQASATDYAYKSGAYDVNSLLRAVPNLDQLAVITGEQVANIGSQDMNDEVWLKLAKRVNAVLAEPGINGVLITHGTDTLEETSYFLSLVSKSDKPVVMVGSMRPATAVSADGPGNIYNGVAVVADPRATGKGTLVVLNDTIHYARNVSKTDTTSVQTFQSLNRGPAGVVHTGKILWFEPMDKMLGKASDFSIDSLDKLPRVDIIYAHANMSADLIDAAIKNGAKGLVIAGVGDGNMTTPALDALTKAAESGVVVVRSTRLAQGITLRNNEVNDDEKGFVASGELNPPKSRVLLKLALTTTTDPGRIQKMFNEY
jgi:L-asparaginase